MPKNKAVVLTDEEWSVLLEMLGYAIEVWWTDHITAKLPAIQDKIKAALSTQLEEETL